MSLHHADFKGSLIVGDLYLSVLNMRYDGRTEDAVYIGRGSRWGNPFVIGKDGSRDDVIAKYAAWFETSGLDAFLHEIEGRNLVCHCAPLRCHGDFLLYRSNLRCQRFSA